MTIASWMLQYKQQEQQEQQQHQQQQHKKVHVAMYVCACVPVCVCVHVRREVLLRVGLELALLVGLGRHVLQVHQLHDPWQLCLQGLNSEVHQALVDTE
jgi:hypothetical protein